MKINNNKVYINYFDSISCAGDSSEELFEAICQKQDTISIDSTYVKDKNVAIGKISKNKELNDILFERLEKLLSKQCHNENHIKKYLKKLQEI